MIKTKKGAANMDMIVWLAIGVVVLIVVVIAFTGGFNKAWDKLVGVGDDAGSSLPKVGVTCTGEGKTSTWQNTACAATTPQIAVYGADPNKLYCCSA